MKVERNDTRPAALTLGDLKPGMCFEIDGKEEKTFMMMDYKIDLYHLCYVNLENGKILSSGKGDKVNLLNAKVVVEDNK